MLMYSAFTLDSIFKLVPPKGSDLGSEQTWQTSMLYSYIVLLIDVYETICMEIHLSSSPELIITQQNNSAYARVCFYQSPVLLII